MESEIRITSPFPLSAVPRVWSWCQEFRGRVADDFGPKTLAEFVTRWERTDQKSWAIYRGDELGGMVSFERWTPNTGTAHCTFKRSFWGWKTTLPALQKIAAEIFASDVHKLVFMVYEDNHAIRSLLKQLGAVQEGLVRDATKREGKFVAIVLMGLTQEGLEHGRTVRKQDEHTSDGQPERADVRDVQPGSFRTQ